MASGGYHPTKQTKSEQKRRSNWQRSVSSERDDAQSLNSLPSDIRINNWDLADLRPLNLGDSKRRKKSKGNTEREREQSLSMDSPPRGEQKHHTPSSFSRTKITPSTPTSQRVALENLKQHMTFSDLEDPHDGVDNERNNERHVSQARSRFQNTSINHADSETDANHINRNNNMDYGGQEQGPDSNEIVARLMQIRDFMKQARSMLDSMERMGERKKSEDVEKVRRLIVNLQEQEQGYKGLLQNTLKTEREVDGASIDGPDDTVFKADTKEELDDSSVDLEVRTQNSETTEGSQENLSRPRIEDKLGLGSEDEDAEYSNSALPLLEDALVGVASPSVADARDKRMDAASVVIVQETEEGAAGGVAIDGGTPSFEHAELVRLLHEKQQQLQTLMQRQEELNVKRREMEKKLMEAQARDNKARASLAVVSSGRQALAQKIKINQAADAGKEGAVSRWQREGGGDAAAVDERDDVGEDGVLKSNIVGYPESDDDDNSNVREVDALPSELLELKRQLNFLRNEFSQQSTTFSQTREAPKNTEAEAKSDVEDGRQQLQNKLQELQNKKYRMDKLLQELQMLHMQPLSQNNAQSSVTSKAQANIPPRPPPPRNSLPNLPTPASLPPSLQARMSEVAAAAPDAVDSAMATFADLAARGGDEQGAEGIESATLEEVQEKLRRLKEVRSQLDKLRGLVTYYQHQKDRMENRGEDDDMLMSVDGANLDSASNPMMSQNVRKSPEMLQYPLQQRQQHQEHQQNRPTEGSIGASARAPSSVLDLVQLLNFGGNDGDEHSDEDNVSVSQSDSQWSNLGPWDDDPEIQEKVKKLKAAKEKLKQLQDLVAFVQQSPDPGRGVLPPSLGELAASIEGEAVSQATQTDEPNVSMSEGEVPADDQRQRAEDVTMDNTRAELEQLRRERASLLDLQSQLKRLHAVVGRTSGEPEGSSETEGRTGQLSDRVKGESDHAPNATVVTFASNDELYSKMRRQRILREELRSKKKELEAIMKKDRNKRQYSRNQDNQSDTVSLNTDTFGIPASVDATMATWGGSTVDNLENITEDDDGQGDDDEDEDDGYPSDGIVQVEEEEEENDTDNGTYTIEADARQRQKMRKPAAMGIGARPKTSRGKQTFPQPSYSDQTMKKTSQKHTRRSRTSHRESKLRQGNYRSAEELIQEDENELKGKNTDWVRLMEGRLNNLSSSVESLMRKLDSNGRQLSVSLNQENTTAGTNTLMSPMQEQMIQLHNQSMMLSFSHVIQSLTRQQGDMQQMQQQMQNLQIQLQDVQHEHGYQTMNNTAPAHALRPSLSASMLNNSSYNLHATAPSLSVNAQNLSSPFASSTLNNTAPPGFIGSFGQSPPLPHLPATNLVPPSGTLGGLSVSTGSNLSLHQQTGVPSHLAFNPSNSAVVSHGSTSVSTMTRDFSQFVNTLPPTEPSSHIDNLGQFSNLFEPTQNEEREEMEESREMRMNAYKVDRKRKPASWMKRSESNPSTGLLVSTPKVENHKAEDRARRGPIGRENSTEFSNMATVFSATNGDMPRDIDHTDFGGEKVFDASSSYSSIQSIRNEHTRLKEGQGYSRSANSGDEANTLFDSLRDTIYTEVASLISQNENRPHFLLELFREMRQIDSDFLRQRTLYSLQDVLNSTLKSNSSQLSQPTPAWLKATSNVLDTANSDQTPSESMTSEDDEDAHVALLQQQLNASKRDAEARGQRQAYTFDYEETADNPSSLSTPSNYEESPFFQDALGETVIELDSLKRNESKQASKTKWGEGAFLASEQLLRGMKEQFTDRKESRRAAREALSGRELRAAEGLASATVDQASESSMSDIPYPRIDMKQLDRQIKQVMMETIPIIKEHMDDVCSPQLLAYVKRLILSLTSQSGSQKFDRFFQCQLSSILQDTLEKYEGRKISDCGEDLLVEISDVLFNELAFFRLMQDLDDPNIVHKMKKKSPHSSQKNKSEKEDASDSSSSTDDDSRQDEELPGWVPEQKNGQKGFRVTEAEQEEMGRERDDELANETNIRDADEKDEDDEDYDDDNEEQSYKIELAPSETKPFTRIGSDEDDDNSDEEQSIEDPSETAVSRNNALMGTAGQQSANNAPPPLRPETEGSWGDEEKEKQDAEKSVIPSKIIGKNVDDKEGTNSESQTPQLNGSVNGEAAHSSNDEEGGLTVDDLPERLTVGSSNNDVANASPAVNANNTELRQKYEAEMCEVSGLQAVLSSLEGLPELAGDGAMPLDPDSFLI